MGLHIAGFEEDSNFPIKFSPKHISTLLICPKIRKRGNYLRLHIRFKSLDIPADCSKDELQALIRNILKLEVNTIFQTLTHIDHEALAKAIAESYYREWTTE